MNLYIFAERKAIPRLPGEDSLYVKCQIEGESRLYEEIFRFDQTADLPRDLLVDSSIDKARSSVSDYRAKGTEIAVNLDKQVSGISDRDRKILLDFFN